MAAGLLASTAVAGPDQTTAETVSRKDPRWILVKQFFLENGAPAHEYTEDFLIAADQNGLDWRLLPVLSMVESGGGKASKNNNIFGWANGDTKFASNRDGIYRVASRLKHSKFYKGNRSLDKLLRTYNPREDYGLKVKAVMNRLGPARLMPAGAY